MLSNDTVNFIAFFILGNLLTCIFDIFRAYRRYKKVSNNIVIIQDIIYSVIVLIIVIYIAIFILNIYIRFYLFIACFLGIIFYLTLFSKFIIKLFINIYRINNSIINFIFLPCCIFFKFITNLYKFFKKYVKKCCKKIINMVIYIYNSIVRLNFKFFNFRKYKRGS
jgi:hypothetical protein